LCEIQSRIQFKIHLERWITKLDDCLLSSCTMLNNFFLYDVYVTWCASIFTNPCSINERGGQGNLAGEISIFGLKIFTKISKVLVFLILWNYSVSMNSYKPVS
jgi:hypothetical protein